MIRKDTPSIRKVMRIESDLRINISQEEMPRFPQLMS